MRWSVLIAALVACYHPAFEGPCQLACSSDMQCPSDQMCGGNGVCHLRGSAECALIDAATPDTSDALGCFGHGLLSYCLDRPADPGINFGGGTIDTDSDAQCRRAAQKEGSEVCVIAAKTLAVSGHVTAIGSRPLVLLGVDSIWVTNSGVLDVSSHWQQSYVAAGSTTGPCMAPNPPMDTAQFGAGGGAGGSFLARGGFGGSGQTTQGGIPGNPVGAPNAIRGGCPGGAGAKSSGNIAGVGGQAGGAVYLISAGPITIDGVINASGGGGSIPQMYAGGGGGGTGGFIGLDGVTYSLGSQVRIFAIGGGGSSGGGSSMGSRGDEAISPNTTGNATSPDGGGAGGFGGIGVPGAGGDWNAPSGGGGGGGGAGGFIGVDNIASFPMNTNVQPQPTAI